MRSRDASGSIGLPPELELEDVTAVLADDKGRSAAEPQNQEDDDEEKVRTVRKGRGGRGAKCGDCPESG